MCSSLMGRLQYILCSRVVSGNQRLRAEVVAEVRDPNAAHGEWDRDVGQGDGEIFGEAGLDVPEQIDVAGYQHPCGQPNKALDVAFELTREQHEERHKKVEDNQKQADELPSAAQPPEV